MFDERATHILSKAFQYALLGLLTRHQQDSGEVVAVVVDEGAGGALADREDAFGAFLAGGGVLLDVGEACIYNRIKLDRPPVLLLYLRQPLHQLLPAQLQQSISIRKQPCALRTLCMVGLHMRTNPLHIKQTSRKKGLRTVNHSAEVIGRTDGEGRCSATTPNPNT